MSLSLETDEKVQYLPYSEDGDRISDDEMEEDEAPSLCDLPFSTGYQDQVKEENRTGEEGDDYFDFNFNFNSNSNFNFHSIIGSRPELESEMCTADEIFSGGQLLPFHHSIRFPSQSISRSESMDRVRFGSRSSSTTSSSSCSSYNSIKSMGIPNPKARNQFHSYPSPNPRVRAAGARFSTSSMPSATKSTMWQVLRLGLVRTPEIELQGRTNHYNRALNKCTSRSSNNSSSDVTKSTNSNYQLLLSHEITNSSSGGIFKSCKCSVGAIEPMFVRFRADSGTKTAIGRRNKSLADQILNEDKNMAQKKQEQRQERNRQNSELRQGKQAVSHHRTFEWLRDLSHASVLNS